MKRCVIFLIVLFSVCSQQFADRIKNDEKKNFLIVLDPGHGGKDQGTKLSTFYEKKITLTTALLTKKHLEELGYKVIMTRTRDVFVSLQSRSAMANRLGANLFVSIHYNSSPNPEAKGIEIFFYDTKDEERKKKSQNLASAILDQVTGQTQASARGVKKGNFHVIRETEMPAVLLEGGFLTNMEECRKLMKRQYLNQIAQGIATGIDQFALNLAQQQVRKLSNKRPRRELNARPAA